jgi:glycosyltransferase involved in cell wall biosynthesis
MRIAFSWGYFVTKSGWLYKDDGMQYCIREFTKKYDTQVVVLSNVNEQCYCNGINWTFCNTREKVISTLLNGKFDLIHTLGDIHVDSRLLDNKKFKFVHYLPGDTSLNSVYSKCDMIFVSQAIQQQRISKDLNHKKVLILPHAPNEDKFVPRSEEKTYDVFYPTREHPAKRIALLEEACKYAGLSYLITRSSLDRPIYTYDQLASLYQKSKCVCSTSKIEGGSLIILEAMMCNVPVVVCSDCTSNVEFVKRFGGIISKPSVKSLAKNLKNAICSNVNTRKNLIDNGITYKGMFLNMHKHFLDLIQ